MDEKRKVLFYRDFRRISGGHIKLWNYFNHVRLSGFCMPRIHFSFESLWDASNPWCHALPFIEGAWDPDHADILFLAGMDWNMLPHLEQRHCSRPVINLIQGVHHGYRDDPRFKFLANRAIRICVSAEVQESIEGTGHLNGPVYTIPNALDLDDFPANQIAWEHRDVDLLIVGCKKPLLANKIAIACEDSGMNVLLLTEILPRTEFLSAIGSAKITVLLPELSEGFYLPALEALELGGVVICPDCIGNRSFCMDQKNCFFVGYQIDELLSAITRARAMGMIEREAMFEHAKTTANKHLMLNEQKSFLNILKHVDQLW